ncbi:hypothetical protein B0H67DRAFT_212828 [Lasiosphaeris hirsuta]|uniref:Uncharacterized protein n=1 Tax=Lasiosphaeris hirsuta TaxID=260670 RepID=A0AA40ASD4_9PEZI|nr:hypothetical protein B0H67DRAFT_212828 [Lasiosphaeris hirsuta]
MEEYLSIFITHDIELEKTSAVSVSIKARRPSGMRNRLMSRRNELNGYHALRSSHAAGFLLGSPSINPLDEDDYGNFECITIEFPSEREFEHFTSIWSQAIEWRRGQRKVLSAIEEEIGREQLTSRQARGIWFHSES